MGVRLGLTGFVGRAGDLWPFGWRSFVFPALSDAFLLRTGQAARLITSARFMLIATATSGRWQALWNVWQVSSG